MRRTLNILLVCCIFFAAPSVHSAQASMLQWPVEFAKPWTQISSTFGPRLRASRNYEYEFHKGIDIAGETTDVVVAAADGEVSGVYIEGDPESLYPNGGNVVVLRHTAATPIRFHNQTFSTYYTLYLHLSSIDPDVHAGDSITAGDALGFIGSSGTTDFTHLHFEVRIGTVCSQTASCNTLGFDPHTHPLKYLTYPQRNHIKITHDIHANALRVHLRTRRNEPDINRVVATTFDSDGNRLRRRVVNFSARAGTSQNTIVLKPKRYSTRSRYYRLGIRFRHLVEQQTQTMRVKVCDVRKHCTRKIFSR